MDYSEKYTGSKEEFYFFLKDEVIRLFTEKLKIDGTRVLIPDDEELDYEFKLDSDVNYGAFTISVKWGEKQPKPANKLKDKLNQYEEFDENPKQAAKFKENSDTNSDGMEITTHISFDY
ncbi:hypothetical protein [Clostridium sp.]